MTDPESAARPRLPAAALGLLSAALFGVSAPLAKLLLPGIGPLLLAGLLYLGTAIGLFALEPFRRSPREAKVRRADLPLLLGIIVSGGVLGPTLLLVGLTRLSGLAGALLLNLEAPFTIGVAVLVFKEHLGRREVFAAALIVAGGVLLAVGPGALRADWSGVLAIAAACASWAVDNNLAQRLSLRDPIAVVRIKGLGAGAFSVSLALVLGERLPAAPVLAASLGLGLLSYGLSIVLHLRAMRSLGAARQAALFATAPFIGALASIPLLGDSPQPAQALAGAAMAAGVVLLLRARHSHPHTHEEMEHDHLHVHDEHHTHAHEGPFTEPHAHPHRHAPLTHDHPHVSDLHHRHRHS